MLWTTPESLNERLPLVERSSGLSITADARIDNRAELSSLLELERPLDELSDSELILAAFAKWRDECPKRLLGDFAFAIWDHQHQRLFCARDHFGVKPFYYYVSKTCFAFATEIKALHCLPYVPRRVNETAIADYFLKNFEDKQKTFYDELLRLPAGHSLSVQCEKSRLTSYYALEPTRELLLHSNEEYAEGLHEIFTEAVRCRMRSALPVGSFLSGGLDSSSIASVARNLLRERNGHLLPTFSLVYDRIKECDERRYMDAVLAQGGFESHFVPGDDLTPLNELENICGQQDRASIAPGLPSSLGLYEAIKQSGVRVIFDGHDGDNAVSYGYGFLDELAQRGHWLALAAEAKELAPLFQLSQWKIMKAYVRRYRWRPLMQKHPTLKKADRIGGKLLRRTRDRSWEVTDHAARCELINKDLTQRTGVVERYKSIYLDRPKSENIAREEHYRSITNGVQSLGLEENNSTVAAFGLEARYPFWDKRLIEYCLSLPGAQKCFRGWNRVVMRRAMDRVLPSDVCWRRDKTDFTANFMDGLSRDRHRLKELVFCDMAFINHYFEMSALQQCYERFDSRRSGDDSIEARSTARILWDIAALTSWSRYTASSDVNSLQREVIPM
jgi:asparagine synthase (glutamine-hydrolysing)